MNPNGANQQNPSVVMRIILSVARERFVWVTLIFHQNVEQKKISIILVKLVFMKSLTQPWHFR